MFLEHQWSPEEISGCLRFEHSNLKISYNTIYHAIYARLFDTPPQRCSRDWKGARKHLRHKGKTHYRKGEEEKHRKMKITNPLEARPEEANNRSRIGERESDPVIGKIGGSCLVTLVDRQTLFLKATKVEKKSSVMVRNAMLRSLKDEPCFTIILDKEKEFAKHAEASATLDGVQFYFPEPHQPWQRGRNENTNGLLREYFPKGCDFSNVSEEEIQQVVDKINKCPRKTLSYRTPFGLYHSKVLHLI